MLGLLGLSIYGIGLLTEEVQTELTRNPVVTEHLGTVDDCELAVLRSMTDDRLNFFHYECPTENGIAKFEIHSEATGPGDTEEIIEGVIILPNGERHDLVSE